MIYILTLIIVVFIVLNKIFIIDDLSRTIIMMYLLWWGTWLDLSTFNFYDLFSVQTSTYFLLMLNVVMFYIGFLFCGVFRSNNKIKAQSINDKVSEHSCFLKLLIIVVFILAYYWIKYRNAINSGISSNIRMERFSVGNVFSRGGEVLFFNYFIESFVDAGIVVLSYMIIYGELNNVTFVLLSLSTFFYAGIGSGRGPVISVLISMMLIFFIRRIDSRKGVKRDKRIMKIGRTKKIRTLNLIFIIVIALIILIYSAWLTAMRLGYTRFNIEAIQIGWNEFFKQCIVYFTGPFRALDYGLKVYPQSVGYLFGRGTFAGIDEIINVASGIIGISYTSANEVLGNILQNNQILIGYNQYFNYAYTSVMIHYLDFGILGVMIVPFFYGFFVRKMIFLYERRPMIPTLIIVVFLFDTMINSVFSWGLQSPASNVVLIGCYIWYRYKLKKIHNKDIKDINLKISKQENNNEHIMASQYCTSRSK